MFPIGRSGIRLDELGERMADVLDIDKYLGKVENRVTLMGIELEGAWSRFPDGERYERDMSVFENPNMDVMQAMTDFKISRTGELPSKPMFPAEVASWMRKCYPIYVDKTCGLHVHMSFKHLKHYTWLMQPEFPVTMRKYLFYWAKDVRFPEDHHIWERLRGENRFCHDAFWPDIQARCKKDYDHARRGNRYTDINFAYASHKTIECRLLPMMESVELAIAAVHQVREITNACLVKLATKSQKEEEVLIDVEVEDHIERDIIEV